MPPTREELIKDLTDAGLVSSDEVTKIESASGSTGIDSLLSHLVEAGKITQYQADKFGSGNGGEVAFGDYVVLDELGRGGMGTVLRARHRRMDREVAIKVLPVEALNNEAAIARFYQEVKVAAQLTHVNIVHAYDAGEHQGFHYLVMEYVRGNDLGKVAQSQGAIPLSKAVDYTIQAARGLKYAHSKGVVHRDIKPSNLLLDEENVVKILDMGLARIGRGSNDPTQSMHLTTTGQVMGTVDYMAPEQAEDTRNADHRSDIYSLGCTLFRLVTGSAPYSRDTVVKSILAHREDAPPSIGAGPNYERLNQIFQRMVAKKPEHRYQSCDDVISDLELVSKHAGDLQQDKTVNFGAAPAPLTRPLPPVIQQPPQPTQPTSDSQLAPDSNSGQTSSADSLTTAPQGLVENVPVEMPLIEEEPDTESKPSESDLLTKPDSGLLPDTSKSWLNLGIVSVVLALVCCGLGGIVGVVGWVMISGDLRKIDEGKMEPSNRDRMKLARVLCIISVGIMAFFVVGSLISSR